MGNQRARKIKKGNMTKYKLLKDLPWLKAGTVVWVENGRLKKEGTILVAECYEATKNYFWVDDIGNFDENADPSYPPHQNGWFEKVSDKPEKIGRIPDKMSIVGAGYSYEEMIEDRVEKLIEAINYLLERTK